MPAPPGAIHLLDSWPAPPPADQVMSKSGHKSGKRYTVTHPGRRRFKPGPRPKAKKITIANDQGRLTEEQTEKITAVAEQFADDGEFPGQIVTVCSPCACRWDRELARTAFDGWKSLHYGLQQQQHLEVLALWLKPQSR